MRCDVIVLERTQASLEHGALDRELKRLQLILPDNATPLASMPRAGEVSANMLVDGTGVKMLTHRRQTQMLPSIMRLAYMSLAGTSVCRSSKDAAALHKCARDRLKARFG